MKSSGTVSGSVAAANMGLKEYGLHSRQTQREKFGLPRVGTQDENLGEPKEAGVPLSFGASNRVPASVVLKDSKIKLSNGTNPQSLTFFQVQGTKFVFGIPNSVASKLEKETNQDKIRKILWPLMNEEITAKRSGRASPGMFLLFSRSADGSYKHEVPGGI
jgi:hypothetical protein